MRFYLALLGVLALDGRLAAQQLDIGPAPGRLIDVGGRKLHLLCSGQGSPTVVLEAGASAFAIDWTLVQQEMARTNRICSYDRAGSGWSEASTAATRATVAHDLHTLLETAGEQPPYVLVGASRGGIFVRLYQAEYPEQVVGMVLVDPASETRLFTMYQGEGVLIGSLTAEQLRATISPGTIAVPRRPVQTGTPFDRLPPELYQMRLKLDARLIASFPDSVSYDARLAYAEGERAHLARLLALSAAQTHALGDLPLVVLTRGLDWSQGTEASHLALAKLSTNSRHTRVDGAGHEIHLFKPDAVIQAITDVIEAVRTKSALPPR
jgi:pimeloyl-ACP methyl ester carboxylesterase